MGERRNLPRGVKVQTTNSGKLFVSGNYSWFFFTRAIVKWKFKVVSISMIIQTSASGPIL